MGIFDGVLLAVDFDNTFRPEGMRSVPDENLKAAACFMNQGGRFTLATGRDLRSFQSIRNLFHVNAPVILSNGAVLFDTESDTVVYESVLPDGYAGDIGALMTRYPGLGVELHKGFSIYVPQCNIGVREHLARMGEEPMLRPLKQIPDKCTKFALFMDDIHRETDAVHEILTYINNTWKGRYEAYISGGIIDVAAKGISKALGVAELCRLLSIDRTHLYCAGDGRNDLPMMAEARESFAPADSNPAVLSSGATVVRPCTDGSVAHIVEILTSRYSENVSISE